MIHHFDIGDADEYGVECAVLLYNIKFWEQTNRANKRNFHKGRYWTYNSAKAFTELFPYWSRRKVSRLLAKLEEQGAILKGNFNEDKYNQTLWYAPVNPFGQNRPMLWSESSNLVDESVQCTSTDINTDENTDTLPPVEGELFENPEQLKPKSTSQPDPRIEQVASLVNRRPTTKWSEKEIKAFKKLDPSQEDIDFLISKNYSKYQYRRKDLFTLLNNWPGELDRMNQPQEVSQQSKPVNLNCI